MSRVARKRSASGIYHVVLRGVNRSNLFEDESDKEIFLNRMFKIQKEVEFELYAYCLMDNHVHILVKEGKQSISKIIQRITISYAQTFNHKYERCGHLYQGRFKSEIVEDVAYFLTIFRYIHQNPVKAKICLSVDKYIWSSFGEFEPKSPSVNINKKYVLELFKNYFGETIDFRTFMRHNVNSNCLDLDIPRWISDKRAFAIILKCANILSPFEIQTFDIFKRTNIIKKILKNIGISCRQIARITGIPLYLVLKARNA